MISCTHHTANILASRAHQRLHHSLASSTSKAYNQMLRTFLSFCVFVQINIHSLAVPNLLEFMAYNNSTSSAIANHVCAIKTKFAMWGLDISPFNDPPYKVFTATLKVSLKAVIDIPLLNDIVKQCDHTYIWARFLRLFTFSLSFPSSGFPTWFPIPFILLTLLSTWPWKMFSLFHLGPRLRKFFKLILQKLDVSHSSLKFHSFRRSGAPWPLIPRFPFRTSKAMAPGCLTVSGPISLKTMMPQTRWPFHSRNSYFNSSLLGVWGPSLLYL